MAASAVSLSSVSKRYTIYRRRAGGLKDRLVGAWTGRAEEKETIWALNDVSLEVAAGETLAVIGPNGCGKSTLLQLVAGILDPDGGTVTARGRVTSLLELGAGFSPDLSGRDNVYLNASLHGVSRAAVTERFDEIVAFAGLERFIDTPVRNYSSGMYMRLGFSVAAHLDPEIILIDEAFAVGDEAFQRRCLARIRDFQRQGLTIVVVSHDLLLVERLAERACLLAGGRLVTAGSPADVIARYHEETSGGETSGVERRWGDRSVEITDLEVIGPGRTNGTVRTRDPITVRVRYACHRPVGEAVFGIAVHREDGLLLTGPNTRTGGVPVGQLDRTGTVDYALERLPLLPGRYLLSAAVYDRDLLTAYDHRDRFRTLVVVEGGTTERFGVVELGGQWRVATGA